MKLTFRDELGTWHVQVQQPSRSKKQKLGRNGKDRHAKTEQSEHKIASFKRLQGYRNAALTTVFFRTGGAKRWGQKPASGTS